MKPFARNARVKPSSPRGPAQARQKLSPKASSKVVQRPAREPGQKPGTGARRRRRPWLFAAPRPFAFLAEPAPATEPVAIDATPEPYPTDEPPLQPGNGHTAGVTNGAARGAASSEDGEPAQSSAFEWLAPDSVEAGSEFEFEFELESEVTPATLRRGSRGGAVVDLQSRLVAAGYDPRGVDGIFGQHTETAVRNFQRAQGLVVDGIVGPNTWSRLLAGSPVVVPPGGSPPGIDWSSLSADQRMRHAMGVLVNGYGFPVNGAAGIVGNLCTESGVIPSRIEGSSERTPMRAPNFSDVSTDFSAQQIMNRSSSQRTGPKLPGIGLAQWTLASRRAGLFRHAYNGIVLGANIVFDMDAQLDYLVHELRTGYRSVLAVVTNPHVTVEAASDVVTFDFEAPGWSTLPRTHPDFQKNLAQRRSFSKRARQAFLTP
jgi:hypothetical protein